VNTRPEILGRAGWEHIDLQLMVRSGGACEARTPACLAGRDGQLGGVRWSRHHRLPRGMGGTTDLDVHDLPRLLLVCGCGTTGCHGYIEHNRDESYRRGFLVPRGIAPADHPLILASGRVVRLADGGFYHNMGWSFGTSNDTTVLRGTHSKE
jgi:hypothetical protein